MKNKLFYSVLLFVFGFVFVPAAAMGATATTTFNVQVNLVAACTVTSSDVNFGDLPGTGVPTWRTGDVSVNCPPGVAYSISFNGGQNQSGSYRRLHKSGGTYWINYYMFALAMNGTPILIDTPDLTDSGNGSSQPHAIWTVITATPSAPIGLYTDTITATVAY